MTTSKGIIVWPHFPYGGSTKGILVPLCPWVALATGGSFGQTLRRKFVKLCILRRLVNVWSIVGGCSKSRLLPILWSPYYGLSGETVIEDGNINAPLNKQVLEFLTDHLLLNHLPHKKTSRLS